MNTIKIHTVQVSAGVRYWEDAYVNGVEDKDGNVPCRVGDSWKPRIDIANGRILNWELGITAEVHYKVCDDGVYEYQDEQGVTVWTADGYVPDYLCTAGGGYGDYIIMRIDVEGFIKDWKHPNIEVRSKPMLFIDGEKIGDDDE